jgi:shikimate kinase
VPDPTVPDLSVPDLSGSGGSAITAVVLVGLMGSGKTTVGKKVAKLLGWRFVDGDVELEARSGRSVGEWFATDGEDAFRRAEADLLGAVLAETARYGPVVVGAGGGVVVTPANRDRLRSGQVAVVYLHADPPFLASRTQHKPHRPLLTDEPAIVLSRMYEDRDHLYREVADAVVEVRPAHEAGERPKWRLAERVVEALAELGVPAARVAVVAATPDGADENGGTDENDAAGGEDAADRDGAAHREDAADGENAADGGARAL